MIVCVAFMCHAHSLDPYVKGFPGKKETEGWSAFMF